MAQNKKFIVPLGQGPSADPIPELPNKIANLQDTDIQNLEHMSMLVYDAPSGNWIISNLLNEGSVNEVLMRLSTQIGDVGWVPLIDQGVYPMQMTCLDIKPTRVNDTTFTVANLNLTNLLNEDRKIAIYRANAVYTGLVVSCTWDGSSSTVVVTLDNNYVLPQTMDNLCLTGSGTSWVATKQDAFNNYNINDITSGYYDNNQPIVIAVGQAGYIGTSEDGGQTWIHRYTGRSEHLNKIFYSEQYGAFYVCGDNRELLKSIDGGRTWTAYAGTYHPNSTATDHYIDLAEISGFLVIGHTVSSVPITTLAGGDFANNFTYISNYPKGWRMIQNAIEGGILGTSESDNSVDGYIDGIWELKNNQVFNAETIGVTPANTNIKNIIQLGSNALLFSAPGGIVYQKNVPTYVGGVTTGPISTGLEPSEINHFAYSSELDMVIAVADDGKMAYSNDFGLTWDLVENGFGLSHINAICYDSHHKVFIAAGQNGLLARSANGIE